MAAKVKVVVMKEDGTGEFTICLPGILARPEEQFEPITQVLPGRVVGFGDDGDYHDHDLFIKTIVDYLSSFDVDRLNIVGVSMGGMKVPFVVQALPIDLSSKLGRIVIVDAPNGAETMKALPTFMASILASDIVGDLLATRFGDWLVAKMSEPPKDEEISLPGDAYMRYHLGNVELPDLSEWREIVKRDGKLALSGYSGWLWWSWLEWMIRVGRDDSLARACLRSLEGRDAIYIACTHVGNGVVAQPEAMNWWLKRVSTLRHLEVEIVHAGFLQQQKESELVFRQIF